MVYHHERKFMIEPNAVGQGAGYSGWDLWNHELATAAEVPKLSFEAWKRGIPFKDFVGRTFRGEYGLTQDQRMILAETAWWHYKGDRRNPQFMPSLRHKNIALMPDAAWVNGIAHIIESTGGTFNNSEAVIAEALTLNGSGAQFLERRSIVLPHLVFAGRDTDIAALDGLFDQATRQWGWQRAGIIEVSQGTVEVIEEVARLAYGLLNKSEDYRSMIPHAWTALNRAVVRGEGI